MAEEKKKKKVNYSSAWAEARRIMWGARWRLLLGSVLMLVSRLAGMGWGPGVGIVCVVGSDVAGTGSGRPGYAPSARSPALSSLPGNRFAAPRPTRAGSARARGGFGPGSALPSAGG